LESQGQEGECGPRCRRKKGNLCPFALSRSPVDVDLSPLTPVTPTPISSEVSLTPHPVLQVKLTLKLTIITSKAISVLSFLNIELLLCFLFQRTPHHSLFAWVTQTPGFVHTTGHKVYSILLFQSCGYQTPCLLLSACSKCYSCSGHHHFLPE
jgi:hypothetical protein